VNCTHLNGVPVQSKLIYFYQDSRRKKDPQIFTNSADSMTSKVTLNSISGRMADRKKVRLVTSVVFLAFPDGYLDENSSRTPLSRALNLVSPGWGNKVRVSTQSSKKIPSLFPGEIREFPDHYQISSTILISLRHQSMIFILLRERFPDF